MESNHVRDLMEAYSSIYAENEEVEQLNEFSAQAQNFVNDATKTLQSGLKKIGLPINMTQRGTPTEKNQKEKINQNQSFDLFDIIKGHLLDEGFADTEEAALAIMTNMSEEWKQSICEAEIEPPKERVGALTNIDIPMSEREAARQRTLAKAKAKREKKKN